jgi:peptide/nickel transport system substrate-binding protein
VSYWQGILKHRISRRRGLATAGGAAAAAAFLAACGGDDNGNGGGPKDTSGLVTEAVETTSKAKRGGTLRWFAPNEPAHLDVQLDQVAMNQHKNLVYGHYVNEKPGVLKGPAYEEYTPEMMESWEWSPDRLQITFKLRQGVKWHNKAPVNGRLLDAQDVIFSWDRHAARGTDRSFLSNAANPNAPVLSVTATDAQTIVWKLREPVVFLLAALTPTQTGKPNIIPKETDSTFDIRRDMIGTGPFMLSQYTPTVGFTYKRNPDYWDKDWPLVEEIEVPIVLQYPQAVAQLRAGSIYSYAYSNTNAVQAEDIVPLKREVADILIYASEPTATTVRSLVFGWPPTDANKPFKDERVRQAVAMTWDRDAYISAFNNADRFQAEGLPVTTYWNTALPPAYGRWWLDPRGKDFGPNAKYFQRNIEDAKKLLAAAGYPNGIEVTSSYIGGPQLGADFQRQVGVTDEFAKEAGINVKVNVIDYTSQYLTQYRDANGKYDGWLYRAGGSPANDATAYFSTLFHSKYGGPGFLGFDANGTGDGSGDPVLESLLDKARIEPDLDKRRALIHDIQRHLAKAMYAIPHPPGDASFFYTAWAAVQNFLVYRGDRRGSVSAVHTWWLDDTKAPLKHG